MLEFYLLLLCTLLGMFFMLSAGNFMIFYLGLELSTIPLAAMVNFNLHERRSSEGALKLIMSSAFSSGLLLLVCHLYTVPAALLISARFPETCKPPRFSFFTCVVTGRFCIQALRGAISPLDR
jgi:NADH-quinone oxidoreductase subunit N